MNLQLDSIQKWFGAMITRKSFLLVKSSTRSYLKMIFDTYHNKKVSPQLSSFISVQLDFRQWSQEKRFSPVELHSKFSTKSNSKIIFGTDQKKKFPPQLSSFMNFQLDSIQKLFGTMIPSWVAF